MSVLGLRSEGGLARAFHAEDRAAVGRRAADAALVVMLLCAAYLFLHELRTTTFSGDEWVWITTRRGSSPGTFLQPHNGHLSLIPICIYRLMWAIWGLGTYLPNRLLVIGLHLLCSVLVYVYCRRRLSPVVALIPTALVMFLGAGAQNFLWAFQMAWLISVDCGIGALMLLERRTRRSDIAASVLLGCSLASSGVGFGLAIGIAAAVVAAGEHRRRWWVFGWPLAAYAVWWIVYQNTTLTQGGVLGAPWFVWRTVAAAMSGLIGIWDPGNPATGLAFGVPLLIALIVFAAVRLGRGRQPVAIGLIVAIVAFTGSVAVNRDLVGTNYDGRYLYVIGVLVVLLTVELLGPVRVRLGLMFAIGVATIAAVVSGVSLIRLEGVFRRIDALQTRTDLAALTIGRPLIGPGYVAVGFPAPTLLKLNAQLYFAAARSLGTPAFPPSELPHVGPYFRQMADKELINIQAPALQPLIAGPAVGVPPPVLLASGGRASIRPSCVGLDAGLYDAPPGGELVVRLPPHGVVIRATGAAASVSLARFADTYQPLGTVPPRGVERLVLRPDNSAVPWRVSLATAGNVTVCGLA